MPAPSLDFNNLPPEVLNLALRRFETKDLVKISSICKDWYESITKTQAFWRKVLIEEDTTMEEIEKRMQLFNERSGNSLTRVHIQRKIETREERD